MSLRKQCLFPIARRIESRRFTPIWLSGVLTASHIGASIECNGRPTCELVLTESPQELRKEFVPESGIALIRF